MANETIERKVAKTILQQPKKIKIGGKEYRLSKMTFSTIVEMSASVSELPQDISDTKENPVVATLRHGRKYGSAPSVLAVAMVSSVWMMLGRFGHYMYRISVRRKTRRLSVLHSPSELSPTADGRHRTGPFFRAYHFPRRDKYDQGDESGNRDRDPDDGNDSIWALIGSFVKWYRCSFEYALYRLSYENIIMYGAVIPSFNSGGKAGEDGKNDGRSEETLSADNPDDWKKIKQFYRRKKRKKH